jgi:membrane-associated phospholipid phosphatase
MREDRSPLVAQGRLWCATILYLAVAATGFLVCGFRCHLYDAAQGSVSLIVGIGASAFLLRRFPNVRGIAFALSGMLQYTVLSLATAMMAFCAATLQAPLQDAAMLAVDRAIGYDWQSYVRFDAGHRWLQTIYAIGYASILWQPIVVCLTLSLRASERRLVIYQVATSVTLVAAVAIFAVAPVTTAWVHGHVVMPELREAGLPVGSHDWIDQLVELRAGGGRLVVWSMNAGIIGFPSFHCAAALLNGWALYQDRAMRPVALPLNFAMIAATPLLGGHYLVDLIAGLAIALASVILADRLYPKLAGRRTPDTMPVQRRCEEPEQLAAA